MLAGQCGGEPVHLWPLATLEDAQDWPEDYQSVGQFMTTDLLTVAPDDSIDLIANIMH